MTKLYLSLCCDSDAYGRCLTLPQILSQHPQLRGDVVGTIHLREEGIVTLCDEFVFRVSDASFVSPGSWHDSDMASDTRLVLETDVDPVLCALLSNYSDVVKLYRMSIQGGIIRCSVKLVLNKAGSLKRVFSFVREVLKHGAGSLGNQGGIPRRSGDLCGDILNSCCDFFCFYLAFYAFRITDSVSLVKRDEDRHWSIESGFFVHNVDGRSLLYDEASAGVLTFLQEHRSVVPSMELKYNAKFVEAVLQSISTLASDVRAHVLSDQSIAEHSHRNVVAAYYAGKVSPEKSIKDCISGGASLSCLLVNEALEVLAILRGVFGRVVITSDDTIPYGRILRLEQRAALYALRTVYLAFEREDLLGRLCVSIYDTAAKAPFLMGTGSLQDLHELGAMYGRVLPGIIVRYEKLRWLGFFPVNRTGFFARFRSTAGIMDERFAWFCLQDFVLSNTAVIKLEGDVSVPLGYVWEVNNKVHRAYALGVGEDISPDMFGWRKTAVGDDIPSEIVRSIGDSYGGGGVLMGHDGYQVSGKGGVSEAVMVHRKRKFARIVGYSVLALSIAGAVCGPALWATWAYHRITPMVLLGITIALYIVVGTIAEIALGIIRKKHSGYAVDGAELHMCIRLKSDELFAVANNSESPESFGFDANGQFCINSSRKVDKNDSEVFLLERGDTDAIPASGNCILLGMSVSSAEDLELMKALVASSVPGFSFYGADSNSPVLKAKYAVDLSSSRAYNLRIAEALGRAGCRGLLLAYLDAYVAEALKGVSNDVCISFTQSSKWKLLCQDQFRWGIVDRIVENCGADLQGKRARFISFVQDKWRDHPPLSSKRAGLLEGISKLVSNSVGFPFDLPAYRDVAKLVPGYIVDGGKCRYEMSAVFTCSAVHFIRDGEYIPPRQLDMSCDYREGAARLECSSVDSVCSVKSAFGRNETCVAL